MTIRDGYWILEMKKKEKMREKMRLLLLFGLVAVLAGCVSGGGESGEGVLEPPGFEKKECLEESDINSSAALEGVPAPEIAEKGSFNCPQLGCSEHPATAAYDLVSNNVIMPKVASSDPRWSADVRLVKQLNIPNGMTDVGGNPIEDRVYRTFCGDWCQLGFPYDGTYHCGFLFVLRPGEEFKDGAGFDIYIRRETDGTHLIPPKLACGAGERLGFEVLDENPRTELTAEEAECDGEKGDFLNFADSRWIHAPLVGNQDPFVTPRKLSDARRLLASGISFYDRKDQTCKVLEAWVNLRSEFEPSDEFAYLIEEGKLAEALAGGDPHAKVYYKEFRKVAETVPAGKSLQLGTFKPPKQAGWIMDWLTESKPAIYIYDSLNREIEIQLKTAGKLTVSDPQYDEQKGWQRVRGQKDGTVVYQGRRYPYLYYEAEIEKVNVGKEGFLVPGTELVRFFFKELPKWGLNDKEIFDFVDYWMDRLNTNQAYYFIHFLSQEEIERIEPMEIKGAKMESQVRVRMYFQPLEERIEMAVQESPKVIPQREGLTVVEWGGFLDK